MILDGTFRERRDNEGTQARFMTTSTRTAMGCEKKHHLRATATYLCGCCRPSARFKMQFGPDQKVYFEDVVEPVLEFNLATFRQAGRWSDNAEHRACGQEHDPSVPGLVEMNGHEGRICTVRSRCSRRARVASRGRKHCRRRHHGRRHLGPPILQV